MRIPIYLTAALALTGIAIGSAKADLVVRFNEDDRRDRFVVTNETGCTFGRGVLVIDLRQTRSGLLFDSQQVGRWNSSDQPLEIVRVQNVTVAKVRAASGAQTGKIAFSSFAADGRLEITTDVDNSGGSGALDLRTIDPGSLTGARVRVVLQDSVLRIGGFDELGTARISAPNCTSR